ncbi:MAG: hypothetical protein AAGF12_22505 [Myxococcota bacterium]
MGRPVGKAEAAQVVRSLLGHVKNVMDGSPWQLAAAELFGISQAYVSKIYRGERTGLGVQMVADIEERLGGEYRLTSADLPKLRKVVERRLVEQTKGRRREPPVPGVIATIDHSQAVRKYLERYAPRDIPYWIVGELEKLQLDTVGQVVDAAEVLLEGGDAKDAQAAARRR